MKDRFSRYIYGFVLSAFAVAIAIATVPQAHAQSRPLANLNYNTITCGTTATPIVPTSGSEQSVYCEQNVDTNAVFYGGADVAATAPAPSICTSCARNSFSMDIQINSQQTPLYCRVAATPRTIGCIFGD